MNMIKAIVMCLLWVVAPLHAMLFAYMRRTGLVVCVINEPVHGLRIGMAASPGMRAGGATSRDLHIDQFLSEMAMGYRPENFIADMLFPVVSVSKQSDLYMVHSRADRLRIEKTIRAPGTDARIVVEDIGSNTYFANNYALASPVTIEDRANADPMHLASLINGKSTFILDKLLLDWEARVASKVNSTSNVGSSAAVSSAWTGSGADPLANINTAIDNVHYANGRKPNSVVFGPKAWDSFRRHSTVRNLILGTNNGGGYVSRKQVAELLEIQNVLVGGAFKNTGEEGQSETIAEIWTDNVLVYYRPQSPSREQPSFGYSFRWAAPGLPNMQVERHPYDSKKKAELVEVGYYQDEKITGSTYGFLLTAVNSST